MSNPRLLAAVIAAVLCTLWLPPGPFQAGSEARAASPAAKEAELKRVRGRIDAIRRAIHADAERRDALAGQVKEAELKIQSARERLSDVRARRIASENRLADLKAEQVATTKRIDTQRDALGAEMKVAYMNGRQEQLKLLLNQQDPARLGRMMAYYGYFGRARAERITSISSWPTPTVSTRMRSNPAASSRSHTSRVVVASPPRPPRTRYSSVSTVKSPVLTRSAEPPRAFTCAKSPIACAS